MSNGPVVLWETTEDGIEWRGEWRGLRLAVRKRTDAGSMYEGFINGGQVLRARRLQNARERVAKKASKVWKENQR